MKKLLRGAIAAALITMVIAQSASCNRYTAGLAFRALVTTAVVATVLASHDAHRHHHHCGHRFVVVEERPVYRYQGRWEYYDEERQRWYYYEHLEVEEEW